MSIDYEFLTSVTDINDEVWFEINNRTITPLNKESIIDVLVQNDGNSRNFGFFIQRHCKNSFIKTHVPALPASKFPILSRTPRRSWRRRL